MELHGPGPSILWFTRGRPILPALVTLALAGCASPISTQPATPSVVPTSSIARPAPTAVASTEPPTSSASAGASSHLPTWGASEIPSPPTAGFGGAWPRDVVAGGPGFVAVGTSSPCCADASYDDEPWEAVIWTSTDGVDWALVPDLASFGKAGLQAIDADANGTLVAVGYEVVPPPPDDERNLFAMEARAWRSTDGIDWIAIDGLNGAALHDVVATSDGWTIAGEVDGHPAIFSSPDLATWTALTFDGVGPMQHLAASADGTVVATACIAERQGAACSTAAYIAADGGSWQQAAAEMGFVNDVIAWNGGFLAVGTNEDATGVRTWNSADGVAWEAGPEALTASAGNIRTLADAGDGLIGGGAYLTGDPPTFQPAVWRSEDGADWRPMEILERSDGQAGGQVTAFVVIEDRIVGLGQAHVGHARTYAWTGEP